jgi:hypothetical protein
MTQEPGAQENCDTDLVWLLWLWYKVTWRHVNRTNKQLNDWYSSRSKVVLLPELGINKVGKGGVSINRYGQGGRDV